MSVLLLTGMVSIFMAEICEGALMAECAWKKGDTLGEEIWGVDKKNQLDVTFCIL